MYGVFIHSANSGVDAEIVCSTLAPYGINLIVIEALAPHTARYPSEFVGYTDWHLFPEFVESGHARGMKIYLDMNLVTENAYIAGHMTTRYNNGSPVEAPSINIFDPYVKEHIKNLVQEAVTKYDIDGFNFDYTRYTWGDEPYDNLAKADFIAKTGLSDVNWGIDTHTDNGKYRSQWFEWRWNALSDFVGYVRDCIHQVRRIHITCSPMNIVWDYDPNNPSKPAYFQVWNGQDVRGWVSRGYMDSIMPMAYIDNVQETVNQYATYRTIFPNTPIVLFIDSCVDAVSTPQNIADRINALNGIGADGWIIWRYGGPSDPSGSPDLTEALKLVSSPETFLLSVSSSPISGVSFSVTRRT